MNSKKLLRRLSSSSEGFVFEEDFPGASQDSRFWSYQKRIYLVSALEAWEKELVELLRSLHEQAPHLSGWGFKQLAGLFSLSGKKLEHLLFWGKERGTFRFYKEGKLWGLAGRFEVSVPEGFQEVQELFLQRGRYRGIREKELKRDLAFSGHAWVSMLREARAQGLLVDCGDELFLGEAVQELLEKLPTDESFHLGQAKAFWGTSSKGTRLVLTWLGEQKKLALLEDHRYMRVTE